MKYVLYKKQRGTQTSQDRYMYYRSIMVSENRRGDFLLLHVKVVIAISITVLKYDK